MASHWTPEERAAHCEHLELLGLNMRGDGRTIRVTHLKEAPGSDGLVAYDMIRFEIAREDAPITVFNIGSGIFKDMLASWAAVAESPPIDQVPALGAVGA